MYIHHIKYYMNESIDSIHNFQDFLVFTVHVSSSLYSEQSVKCIKHQNTITMLNWTIKYITLNILLVQYTLHYSVMSQHLNPYYNYNTRSNIQHARLQVCKLQQASYNKIYHNCQKCGNVGGIGHCLLSVNQTDVNTRERHSIQLN